MPRMDIHLAPPPPQPIMFYSSTSYLCCAMPAPTFQVHASILDDLVYPTEIVGKRVRYHVDGSKVLKVCMGGGP